MNPNPSVSDKVVQKIIDRLARRELKPGDKLPSEAVMAAELGVSRIALREGLKALAAKGLIVTRHGEGSFINQYSPKLLSDTLFNLSLLNDGPLLEILQLRKLIETEAARLCASNATAEELAEIVPDFLTAWDHAISPHAMPMYRRHTTARMLTYFLEAIVNGAESGIIE